MFDNMEMINFLDKNIKTIENSSDEFMTRAFVTFNNNETISIIRGKGSYGGSRGLFEISVSNPSVFNYDHDDGIMGLLSETDVLVYIDKLGELG